jgi:hypothetical protein
MFDSAVLVLEEIAPENKNRNEVLGARVNLFMGAKKWDMAATLASHLVKVQPENGSLVEQPRLFRRAGEVERDHRNLGMHCLHPQQNYGEVFMALANEFGVNPDPTV